jgi:hypothetical protein
MLSRKGSKYGLSLDTSPFDPMANALMGGEYINESISAIGSRKLGDVYTAHVLGAGGAKKLFNTLEKSPYSPAYNFFPKEAASNKSIFYDSSNKPRTIIGVYEELSSRVGQPPDVDRLQRIAKSGSLTEKFEDFKSSLDTLAEKSPIFSALYKFSKDIGNAAMNALKFEFDDRGLRQNIDIDKVKDELRTSFESSTDEIVGPSGVDKRKKESKIEPSESSDTINIVPPNRPKQIPKSTPNRISMPSSVAAQRSTDTGIEISPNFTNLEREIFSSLDLLLPSSITKYPFESQIMHSY